MPSKFQTTVAMAEYTAKDISFRPEVFAEFLTTAAHNYKYGFRDQMLIFAQKPNATACAEIEVWNKLGRYVNRGTMCGFPLTVERTINLLKDTFRTAHRKTFNTLLLKADIFLSGIVQLVGVLLADALHKPNLIKSVRKLIA